MPPVPAPPAMAAPPPPAVEVAPVEVAPVEAAIAGDLDDLEPLLDLRLPVVPMPRLELPPLEALPAREPAGRHLTVAGFVAAELRSIPAQWIEEA
ncbi:MAG: hypothetical protein ACREQ5_28450, partial [Candidatus Dormibacteria bacterium]